MLRWFTPAILVIGIVASLYGCSVFKPNLTAAQAAYLDKASAAPLQFTVSEKELPQAWQRARNFVEKHGALRIVRSDERDIATEPPAPDGLEVGYEIHNTPAAGGNVRIVVNAISNARGYGSNAATRANRSAHILAYYIRTGELDASLLDQ